MPCRTEGWNFSPLMSLTQCGSKTGNTSASSPRYRIPDLSHYSSWKSRAQMQDVSFQLSGPQWPESHPPPLQGPKFLPGAVHSSVPHLVLPAKLLNPEFGWKLKSLVEYLAWLLISCSSSEWTEHRLHTGQAEARTAPLVSLPQAPRVPAQTHPEGRAASSPCPWNQSCFTATSQWQKRVGTAAFIHHLPKCSLT